MKKAIFFLVLALILNPNVSAFSQLAMEKFRERIDIAPGETVKGAITLSNRSDQTENLKVYLQDVKFLPPFNGQKEFLPVGSTPYSCSEWITVTPDVLSIPPNGKEVVNYSIKVPEGVKGGYCGTIFFERDLAKVSGVMGVGVVMRWGYTLLLEARDKIKEAKIEEFSGGRKGIIQASITNTGNVILVSKPDFSVMDDKDTVLERGKMSQVSLPPGEKTIITAKLSPKIPAGKYTLFMNFDFGGGSPLTKEIHFSKSEMEHMRVIKVKE